MNFYLILLKDGNVVDVCRYDDEDAQLTHFDRFVENVGDVYDDVQIFNEVR